jgi:hypothetical protein
MKEILPGGHFPNPEDLDGFLKWDDWRVLGLLASGAGGEHGARLSGRNHYRLVFQTNEVQTQQDREKLMKVRDALGDTLAAEMPASKSWYKTGDTDISVYRNDEGQAEVAPLSEYSSVVRKIGKNDQVMLYCLPDNRISAARKVREVLDGME